MSQEVKRSQAEEVRVYLRDRKMAYVETFKKDSLAAQFVLEDLAKFCRAHKTTFDPMKSHERLEGRREVFLRIAQHLELSIEDLFKLITKGEGA